MMPRLACLGWVAVIAQLVAAGCGRALLGTRRRDAASGPNAQVVAWLVVRGLVTPDGVLRWFCDRTRV